MEVGGRARGIISDIEVQACITTDTSIPNFDLPFEIHADASLHGLGAVLYQTKDGTPHVIAYASRGLSISEKNYPANKLEFLALKLAVTEKFQDYLYTVSQEPQCARFSRVFTCPPIV